MARHEVLVELREGKAALVALGAGIGIAAIGGWLLLMMGVHLLHARTTLPLWACEGIGGGGLLLLGTILVYRGRRRIVSVHVVPRQTVAQYGRISGGLGRKSTPARDRGDTHGHGRQDRYDRGACA